MRIRTAVAAIVSVIVTILYPWTAALSQPAPESDALFEEIARMDSTLFDAFNKRDLDKLRALFTRDLEFYHDQGGLGTYEQNMESFERLFAQNNDLKRTLVDGSLEVYPVKDYGAIEVGEHTFCHTENGLLDCGTFKFVHIWKKENGRWKISRVVSYGH